MKVCWITLYNKKYEPVFKFTEPNLINFCKINDFFLEATEMDQPYEVITFHKQIRASQLIDYYDWVIWCDSDILIKNPQFYFRSVLKDFDEKNKSFLVSQDNLGVCAGFFAVKNNNFGKKFINTWAFLHEFKSDINIVFTDPKNGNEGDQHTLRCLYHSFPIVRDNTDFFPENLISNPNSKELDKKLSFAHHFFGRWISVDDILKGMKEII